MTDRELLELAAKAAGIYKDALDCEWYDPHGYARPDWNPLTDDGDALRLAVALNMGISIPVLNKHRADVISFLHPLVNVIEEGNDPYSATRRAIVRAAAESGKDMK